MLPDDADLGKLDKSLMTLQGLQVLFHCRLLTGLDQAEMSGGFLWISMDFIGCLLYQRKRITAHVYRIEHIKGTNESGARSDALNEHG